MKKANFGAYCPHCGVGTMVASVLSNEKKEFLMFYVTSDGNICFDGICSYCERRFEMSFPIMELLFQCFEEGGKIPIEKREHLHVFKKQTIF